MNKATIKFINGESFDFATKKEEEIMSIIHDNKCFFVINNADKSQMIINRNNINYVFIDKEE